MVAHVTSPMATWTCLMLLLSIHLATNYAAVKAVSIRTLNRQRANIVISHLLETGMSLSPEEVSAQERIFEKDGVLRWQSSAPIARAKIGLPLQELFRNLGPTHDITGAIRDSKLIWQRLVRIFSQEEYLIWYDAPSKKMLIVLKEHASPQAQIKAWALSLWAAHRLVDQYATSAPDEILQMLESVLVDLTKEWNECTERMKAAGWDLDTANLETTSSTRFRMPHAEIL